MPAKRLFSSEKRDVRLYNVLFPIWMLLMLPSIWLIVLPVNFVVDSAVLIITLCVLAKKRGEQNYRPWRDWLRSIWLVWIFGFISDIVASGFLLFWGYVPAVIASTAANSQAAVSLADSTFAPDSYTASWWEEKISNAISTNPFENIFAFLFVAMAVALAGLLIYVFNKKFSLHFLDLEEWEKKRTALMLAVITAPYVMFIPSEWMWSLTA